MRVAGLVAGIAVLAFFLRVVGLGYGLPAVYNPDEVAILNRALAFSSGDLNPHNFVYPTLYFYVLFAWEGLWFLAGHLAGVYVSLAAFERSFFVDPTLIYLAGRVLTVVCGVLTVAAVHRLGARLFDRVTGLGAALMLAVAPLAVRDAHYIKHDVPVTLLIVVTHVVLAGLVFDPARDRPRGWILAGVVAGLAMSVHYYAIVLVAPMIAAAVLAPVSGGSRIATIVRRLVTAGLACAAAVVLTSPFLFVDLGRALQDVTSNHDIVMGRVTTWFGAAPFYLAWLARDAVGVVVFVLAIAGLVIAAAGDRRRAVLAVTFPAAFLLFIANTFPASRYLNAVVPFVALFAGRAIAQLATARPAMRLVAGVVLALAAVPAGLTSLHIDRFFRQTDTRTLALQWIERELPPGTSVLVQPYSVPLRPSREALVEALTAHLGSPERASVKFRRELALDPYPEPAYRTIYLGAGGLDTDKIYVDPAAFDAGDGLAPLRALAVTHVVLKRYNVPDPSLVSLRADLAREGRMLASFSPYRPGVGPERQAAVAPFLHNADTRIDDALERPGPIVEIWAVD
ncbi:MAG TPA: glycosyltransferase family 39 protein [Vicinamibacterales bacterium]|nr:glycosyltransferase family 39 protein [Vicinamibacterales bacterium]